MTRLIISDIDGTLVSDGTPQLNPEYYEVIRNLVARGYKVCIGSGRQFDSIRRLFEPVQDMIYYICEGGGVVRTLDEIIDYDALPDDWPELIKAGQALQEYDIMVNMPDDAVVLTDKDSELYQLMTEGYHYTVKTQNERSLSMEDKVVKVSFYHSTDAEGLLNRSDLREKWEHEYQILCAGVHWIDCVSMTSNKGNAVKTLQKHLGITKEETMVFGDNMNDIAMFEEAGISYAVGSAREEVKAAASRITDLLENDGVLQVLKTL